MSELNAAHELNGTLVAHNMGLTIKVKALESAIRAAMEIMPFGDAYAILSRVVNSHADAVPLGQE